MIFQNRRRLFLIRKWICESACHVSESENDFPNRHVPLPDRQMRFQIRMPCLLIRKPESTQTLAWAAEQTPMVALAVCDPVLAREGTI